LRSDGLRSDGLRSDGSRSDGSRSDGSRSENQDKQENREKLEKSTWWFVAHYNPKNHKVGQGLFRVRNLD
jgi:hypothetical protein